LGGGDGLKRKWTQAPYHLNQAKPN